MNRDISLSTGLLVAAGVILAIPIIIMPSSTYWMLLTLNMCTYIAERIS
jgi:hypothetical protein